MAKALQRMAIWGSETGWAGKGIRTVFSDACIYVFEYMDINTCICLWLCMRVCGFLGRHAMMFSGYQHSRKFDRNGHVCSSRFQFQYTIIWHYFVVFFFYILDSFQYRHLVSQAYLNPVLVPIIAVYSRLWDYQPHSDVSPIENVTIQWSLSLKY